MLTITNKGAFYGHNGPTKTFLVCSSFRIIHCLASSCPVVWMVLRIAATRFVSNNESIVFGTDVLIIFLQIPRSCVRLQHDSIVSITSSTNVLPCVTKVTVWLFYKPRESAVGAVWRTSRRMQFSSFRSASNGGCWMFGLAMRLWKCRWYTMVKSSGLSSEHGYYPT